LEGRTMHKQDIEEYLIKFKRFHTDGKVYVGAILNDGSALVGYYDLEKNTAYDTAAIFDNIEMFSGTERGSTKDFFWFMSERLLEFTPDFYGEFAVACEHIASIYAIVQLKDIARDVTEKANYTKPMSKRSQSKWKEFLDFKKSVILKTLTSEIPFSKK
jgi:hypothetical protein